MADPIRLGNFFSTFDTEAVINQLTQLRQAPILKLQVQRANLLQQKTTLNSLSANFSGLLLRAKMLAEISSVSGKTATVDGTGVSAAAGPGAAAATFSVAVTRTATGTTATGSALSAAVTSAVPLDTSNLAIPVSAGSFTIRTATGGTQTFQVGPTAAEAAVPLATSNFRTAVTAGSFTLSTAGGTVAVTVDPATQSLDDVVAAINSAGASAGLTAAISNDAAGRANGITLTSTNGNIGVGASGDTSNFLAAVNLTAGPGSTTVASTSAFTVMQTLDQVLADINASTIGVTASLTADSNGRLNLVQLASTQGAISLGQGGDTSNFLTATHLLASPGTTSRTSSQGIARLNSANKMADAAFAGGPPAAGDHTFTINGVSIAYNAATDSLNDVIGRINASAAGVSARYDTITDSIKLTQARTGSIEMSLADDGTGGDFLAKTGLLAATQVVGSNAEYSIDGSPPLYSDTNTVNISGVTLTLSAATGGTPAKVTVAQDSAGGVTAVKNFVAEYNALMDGIAAATKHSASANGAGPLSGDTSLLTLQASLRSMVSSMGTNLSGKFQTLSQIGLSFGAIGAAVGSTTKLVFDEAKFTSALATDPAAVQSLLSEFKLDATLVPAGTGSLASITGTFAGSRAGNYAITDDGAGNLTAVFTPADGGPESTTTGTIAAGGTNSTLIPGLTLTAGALQAGTNTIAVAASKSSVIARIRDFLETQSGAGGVVTKRLETYDKRVADIDKRAERIQASIDKEMEVLRAKFRAMEQAQARAQSIMQQLQNSMASVSSNKQ